MYMCNGIKFPPKSITFPSFFFHWYTKDLLGLDTSEYIRYLPGVQTTEVERHSRRVKKILRICDMSFVV